MNVDSVALILLAAVVGIVCGQLLRHRPWLAVVLVGLFVCLLVGYALSDTSGREPVVVPDGPPVFANKDLQA